MELRHLRYFVTVADLLSFRKAAETLHISQPPLSQQIQDLERELGTDLFIRDKRTIRLTESGKNFLISAKKILKDAEKAKADVKLASTGKLGTLSIRFISSASAGTLQSLVSKFKRTHPLVELDIEQSNNKAIIDSIQTGKIDIGLVRMPMYLIDNLIETPILIESYYVALPSTHPLLKKQLVSPQDLKNEKLIIYPRHSAAGSFDDVLSIFTTRKITPEIVQETVEQLTIAGLVATGMGYSIVPECMTKIRVPGVSHVPLKGGKNKTGIAIVARKDANPIVKTFLQNAIVK